MKLRIDAAKAVYYPDVMLTCAADDDHPQYKTSPCVVVEVLSPSTSSIDRREKRAACLGLASLQAYLLVDADHRNVEVFLRDGDRFVASRMEERQPLLLLCGSGTIGLTLDDVYEDVEGLTPRA